jgi:hypothetical protein
MLMKARRTTPTTERARGMCQRCSSRTSGASTKVKRIASAARRGRGRPRPSPAAASCRAGPRSAGAARRGRGRRAPRRPRKAGKVRILLAICRPSGAHREVSGTGCARQNVRSIFQEQPGPFAQRLRWQLRNSPCQKGGTDGQRTEKTGRAFS